MQRQNLNNLLKELKEKMGEKIGNEAFLSSKNWLPRAWRQLSVLEDDIQKRNQKRNDNKLSTVEQAKIVRIILKNMPHKEMQKCLEICGFNEQQIKSMEKHFQEKREFSVTSFAEIMGISMSQDDTLAGQRKSGVKNIVPAVPSEDNQDFNRLLGNAPNVYLSTDQEKIQRLDDVMKLPDWYKSNIFEDPDVLYVALAACREGRINNQQYATLSQWTEMKKHYGKDNVIIVPFLDANDKVTNEAQEYFLKHTVNKRFKILDGRILITKEQEEQLRQHISQLPPSERVIMRLPIQITERSYANDILLDFFGTYNLGIFDGTQGYTMLSTGAYQSLIQVAFPDCAFGLEPRLGEVNINDVEKSMRKFNRPVSVYYPHPQGMRSDNPRFFHGTARKGVLWIGYHDMFHALYASSLPKKLHPIVFQAIDLIRERLSIAWSSDLWGMVDYIFREITPYQDSQSNMLVAVLRDVYLLQPVTNINKKFSPEIAALMLDVFFNPEKWQTHSISSESLIKSIKDINCSMEFNFSYLKYVVTPYFNKEDPMIFSLFKAAVLVEAEQNYVKESKIHMLLNVINSKKNDILPTLSICTVTTINNRNDTHRNTRLKWGEKIFGETDGMFKTVCALLPSELKTKLCRRRRPSF